MNESVSYYAATPLLGGEPTAVFRFFASEGKLPERYMVGAGWIEDARLILRVMSGDLDPSDTIEEEKAMEIVERLEGRSNG